MNYVILNTDAEYPSNVTYTPIATLKGENCVSFPMGSRFVCCLSVCWRWTNAEPASSVRRRIRASQFARTTASQWSVFELTSACPTVLKWMCATQRTVASPSLNASLTANVSPGKAVSLSPEKIRGLVSLASLLMIRINVQLMMIVEQREQ